MDRSDYPSRLCDHHSVGVKALRLAFPVYFRPYSRRRPSGSMVVNMPRLDNHVMENPESAFRADDTWRGGGVEHQCGSVVIPYETPSANVRC
ncbi:MAG: hypothetical protein ACLRS8_18270 [Parabacteroides merdae]